MDNRILKLLRTLQERPGAFFGKKSLERLVDFIGGYIHCLFESEGVYPDFFIGFQEFIEAQYDLQDNPHVNRHWSTIISFFNCTEEAAFDDFFMKLDLFLTIEKEDVAQMVQSAHLAKIANMSKE